MGDNINFSQIPLVTPAVVPVMDRVSFARAIGVTEGVVDGWIARGYIPCTQIGRHRLVNLAALTKRCIDQAEFRL
ncbi:hypothetical protein [Pseudogulbenkiania ferrooxidans]|uniref:Helix-turn-helix domain-containing protein n=1 Tax=Pseudogulbenkiania ferrooxidans 2002 TaxID=279714 RepID=B9Z8J1_9NEIS|nr:hypothetical protein [Pseudogulbenkiania ferrooxidans]EEG06929.1 hypothetical protein FuraDRAFT_3677 [Pseudogulbenkiania ferrooxidans 2002]